MKTLDNTFKAKLIYILEIKDEMHKGLLKIGNTTIEINDSIDKFPPNCKALNTAANNRIKQYTNTVGVPKKLLHTELATRNIIQENGTVSLKAFSDHDVHRVLENSYFPKKKLKDSTSKEWFEIDLETAIKAISAVKKNYKNLSNNKSNKLNPIIFRPEQEDAINKTIKQFKTENKMLWNAKMRFGKTLCALEVIKQSGFKKTIIITHRPIVDVGWYSDFEKIFYDNKNYIYSSKNKEYTIKELLTKDKNFIYFVSIQDLRGSKAVGGKYSKNNDIFTINWDFVIVDEAHEGTTTALGNDVIENIIKENKEHNTKFLALSGTPFNILDSYSENIYTWDYVMEQEQKNKWNDKYFGDSNPYDELPKMNIYTYDLGKIISDRKYVELEDKAFNFKEFFRVWTGNIKSDHVSIPADNKIGEFCHKEDINSFLNLITKEDELSQYPYSNEKYRELFKHSLWIVPGVKEAKALSKIMKKHPVFGCGLFDIVNVAGDGDEEEKSEDALKKVRNAIDKAGDGYTITLSCGKLTTGVTVPEWTAVFMLAGSFSTSASNYLQTIFRVQSPCNINGKIKQSCYVFDFAPDRTLKMVAESVALSTKAGKANSNDKKIMGKFLNYCPIIAVDGTVMKEYNTNKLLQQLKRAYAEKAVDNGFDDNNLYNDELLKLESIDIEKFNKLKGIVGKTKTNKKMKVIPINDQGFDDEEFDRLTNKKKKNITEEEQEKLDIINEQKKQKKAAISILRGISIRMPLLIYGVDININDELTMDKLVELVDDSSWEEFMPRGVTKEIFRSFIKYYDAEIFAVAGMKIRNIIKSADKLSPIERIKKITLLFSKFKNPDKETVLTPWRVVNMHMSHCLGGYDFYDDKHRDLIENPRVVELGDITKNTLMKTDAKILEINSKTGLYPLYVTYSIFHSKCNEYNENELDDKLINKLWNETVCKNIFVICKTPMAKAITKRTLVGFQDISINAHYFEDLINKMKNKSKQFKKKVLSQSYWNMRGVGDMKFDAIVGNPPYQITDNGHGDSSKPIYNLFIEQAKELNSNYLSMIVPARWYSGGKGLDSFRKNMLNDNRLNIIHDYPKTSDCFDNVNIRGGVCYFLWSKDTHDDCMIFNHINGKVDSQLKRPLLEKNADTFIRYNKAITILRKVQAFGEPTMETLVSSRKPFGLATNFKDYKKEADEKYNIKLYRNRSVGYVMETDMLKEKKYYDTIKVLVAKASPGNDEYPHLVFSKPIIADKKTVCTETYLVANVVEDFLSAENFKKYMSTKFFRFLVLLIKNTQDVPKRVYSYVPQQNLKQEWTDELLYKKYGINEDEIKFINTLVKDVEW